MEGLDEELAKLVKRHELDWTLMHTSALVTITDKLSKTFHKKKATKVMSIQLQQLRGPTKGIMKSEISQREKVTYRMISFIK